MDATRFNQFGRWQGEISSAGRTLAIDHTRVYGTKDRSWGVRPVGDPDTGGAPPSASEAGGIFFLWAPLHWKHRCTHAGIFETNAGVRWHWNGATVPVYDDPAKIPLVDDPGLAPLLEVDHHVEYVPGTRRASRALITKVELDGTRNEIELLPLTCFRMKGIGYQHPVWGHCKWRGELAIGGESWKCSDLDENAFENQHIQQVMQARCGDDVGVGVLEQILLGPYPKYGFKSFLDRVLEVAREAHLRGPGVARLARDLERAPKPCAPTTGPGASLRRRSPGAIDLRGVIRRRWAS